ncbi:uncharacterized protein LOC129597562 [Paramacrobiotus metropolitanus]|uniref:uncharacterized protein LOC129597562 n=1 Tax=Paramacrobiotus metropolitanus TaxID=2943436 RepID=UPI002445B07B|nr:uncharacterized protein LOC129597562 [Paramacrobiotus metropolitanus]
MMEWLWSPWFMLCMLVFQGTTGDKEPLQCYSCSGTTAECRDAQEHVLKTCDPAATSCVSMRHFNQPLNFKTHAIDSVYYYRDCAGDFFSRVWLDASDRTRTLTEAEVLMCATNKCNGKSKVPVQYATMATPPPNTTTTTSSGTTDSRCP